MAGLQDAVVDATDGDSTNIFAVDQTGDQRLKRSIDILGRGRNVLSDHAEHVVHALVADVDIAVRPSSATRRVDHREVQRNIVSAKIHQEVKHFVNDCRWSTIGTIHFVHHHDRTQTKFKRLAKDEPRLRHRTLDCIDKQQASISHAQHTFHLATEVGVAGCVKNIDTELLSLKVAGAGSEDVVHGAVLRQNGDSALALKRVGIHHALLLRSADLKGAGLLEERVHERGLTVVNVSDDGNIAKRHAVGPLVIAKPHPWAARGAP